MTPIVKTHEDKLWPISLDTDSGRVFLTADEADSLYLQLSMALIEFELHGHQGETSE